MIKLFSAAKKNHPLPSLKDFSFIQTDIHSHLVPGIDDGSPDMAESLSLIQQLQAMGFSNIVTTPHIKWDRYSNTREIILDGLASLKAALHENNINMLIHAAAEYFLDDHFLNLLNTEPLLTIDENKVLVEFSFYAEPFQPHDIFFRMQTRGYQPVLAHPERYAYYHDKKEMYRTLKNTGVLFQLNLLAVAGYYGKKTQAISEWLLQEGLYDFCGTDLHNAKHAEALRELAASRQLAVLQQYPHFGNSLIKPQQSPL